MTAFAVAALVALLLVAAAGADAVGTAALLARRDALLAFVQAQPVLAFAAFVGAHLLLVSSALPIGPSMSLLAGFLFGRWLGTVAIVLAATAGAMLVYALARSALGEPLRRRAGPRLRAIGTELRDNAFGYVVFLRLVPVVPFFLVNVAAGAFGVPARTFALATLVGRLPATFLYVGLGQELGRAADLADLLSPGIVLSLTGLGVLALVPVALRHLRRRRAGG